MKRRIRKGIPDALRRQAWGTLVGLHEEMQSHPTLYTDLCARTDIPDQEIYNTIERCVVSGTGGSGVGAGLRARD